MISVSVAITAAESKGDILENEFAKLVPKVRREEGTVSYIVLRGTKDTSKFFVYEKYRGKEDMDKHASTDHFKEFWKVLQTCMAGRPQIEICREIG